ncbi:hypothetical protein FB451DRAFT_1360251, partial [Mycena latifolia]
AFQVTPHHCSASIRLESLRITAVGGVRDWVNHPLCPFDFSGVIALSLFIYAEVVRWPKLAPVLRTLKVLDFSASARHRTANRPVPIPQPRTPPHSHTPRGGAAQRVRHPRDGRALEPHPQDRNHGAIASADPEELDAKLSALPLRRLPAVEF